MDLFFYLVFLLLLGTIACFSIVKIFLHRPRVSVVISSYNMAETLPDTIDSILAQTFPDWELIIINDGSKDHTQAVLSKYEDPRIHIITNKKNLGIIRSLNKGLSVARGEYIVRLDADDTAYPDRLERQVKFMDRHLLDLSGAGFDTQDKKYQPNNYVREDWINDLSLKLHLLFHNVLAHPTVIIRNRFLQNHHLSYRIDHPNAEDYDLWVQISMNGGKIAIMGGKPVTTYHYSGHSDEWWQISADSVLKTRREALKTIIPNITDDMLKLPMCELLPFMLEANKTSHVFNQKKLAVFELQNCVPRLTFKHPHWTDTLTSLGNSRFKRSSSDDHAMVSRVNDLIEIRWDIWPTEYFKCEKKVCQKVEGKTS